METGWTDASPLPLIGGEAERQLVVTGKFSSGQLRDLTGNLVWRADPAGVVTVDSTGHVVTAGNGTARITATSDTGLTATVAVRVARYGDDPPVHFQNEVVPLFTKLGCNGGGCHGKAAGQNGFRLSLLGFEPAEDHEHLVKEARGRRLFLAAPDQSLLLRKATSTVPHGGGKRMEIGDPAYRLIRRWIAEGAALGDPSAPHVSAIRVLPPARLMPPHGRQQLIVIAEYSDGSQRDVTTTAKYEANVPEMAEVSTTGRVTTFDQTGDVAIMIRYQSQVAVFRATVPLGAVVTDLPASRNFIDELVFKKLTLLGLPPSRPCNDSTFLRRVTIDIAGRIPTIDETTAFLADRRAGKRDAWIDRLVDSDDYADYFANKWSAILRNKRKNDTYKHGTFAFHDWIRQSLAENRPYDVFVRDIVAASGDVGHHPPVAWYREVNEMNEQVEDTAQLFLGQRIQCARCHHHPFEKWSQTDYYRFAAFFSRVGKKPSRRPEEANIFHRRGVPSAMHPKTKQSLRPAGLASEPPTLTAEDDPRHALVDWMVAPDNPFFARALVNRYWKHFFGRGLVDPEDDLRATNPATNPELLDALADHFTQTRYNLKDLVRTICRSQVYQLSAEPNDWNLNDRQNFSRFYPRRLAAEVLLDSIDQVTGSKTHFDGVPAATRAVQLPDSSFRSYFLTVFGRPESNSACECERQSEANLAQGLHLINSPELHGKLSSNQGRAAQLAADTKRTDHDKVREIYLVALAREPSGDELAAVDQYVQKKRAANKGNPRPAYEDVLWALINTKEFLFTH